MTQSDPIKSISRPRPPAYAPLVLLLAAIAAGIALDRCMPLRFELWWASAALALGIWFGLWQTRLDQAASSLLLASALAAAGAWHHAYWRLYPADEIGRSMDEIFRPAVVEAIAITSPRWIPAPPPTPLRTIPQGEQSQLLVWVTAIRDGGTIRPASGWATLHVEGPLDHIRAGDHLRVRAQGARPAPPLNPGEFDFALHERARRVSCRLFAEFPQSVELLERGSGWSLRRQLADLRSGGAELLRRYIAPRRADLASAILLGTREQLDPHRNEGYLVTGTIHVLSISGLHVGILAAGFFLVLRTGLVPRRITLGATIVLTIGYALLVDLEPPVVRATILVVMGCLALWMGRVAIGFNTLAAAGIAVLILNPASLFQVGAQLSFMAVATMIAFQDFLMPRRIEDPLERLIAATRPWTIRFSRSLGGGMWRLWLTGALIWLISAPLVWKQYNLISPIALVLNFLMWLPVTLAMYAGMGTLALGSFVPAAGGVCGLMCDRCLEMLEWLIAAGRQWPASYFWLAAPPGWWVGLFYLTLGIAAVFPGLRPTRQWAIALGLGWVAGALVLAQRPLDSLAVRFEKPLVCHFVAVGHGISVLVELPDGRTLLYDAGRLGAPLGGVRPISAVLWSRGITHLDALVISHADADHFNAIPDLLDRFSVGAVYVSPVMFERSPPAVALLRDSIVGAGVPIREIFAGQRLASFSDARVEILHPPRKGVMGSDNANSLVLLIEYCGRRILLTGDLEAPGLNEVLAEEPLDCDVILAPHHGSPRSHPGGFADWSTPEFVIVSGNRTLGDLATIESVKQAFRVRGAEVLHTAEDGCIRAEIGPTWLKATTFRPHVRAAPLARGNANFLQTE